MQDAIDFLFGTEGMMPHGYCFLWNPSLLWLLVISNSVTALSYFSIPLALGFFAYKRKDINFKWMLLLFSVFIFACGITHVLSVVTIWTPVYGLNGLAEAFTALVSVATAVLLWPLIPKALRIPSPSSLMRANARLEEEILYHKATKAQLSQLNTELDRLVDVRTQELQASEFRWKYAIEGSGDGLWDWNMIDSTVFFTKRWKEMLGFSEDEIGNGLEEWEQRIHAEDKARTFAIVQDYLDGKIPVYVCEHRVRCKDGGYKWILDRGIVVSRSEDGKPLRMIGTHTDITERKLAEQKNQQLGNILEQSINEIYIINSKTLKFEHVNQGAISNLGYSLDELKHMTPTDIKPELELGVFRDLIKPLLAGEQNQLRFDAIHQRKDGTRYPVEVCLQIYHNDPDYLVTICLDISQRKEMERSLVDERNLLSNLIDNIPDHIFYKNTAGEYVMCNKTVSSHFEESVGSIIGRNDFDLFAPELARLFRRQDADLLAQDQACVNKETISFPNGKQAVLETFKTPLKDSDGNVLGLIGISRDVTQRKAHEEKISRLSNFYACLSKINHAIVHINNQKELFATVCAVTASLQHVKLAWIGQPDPLSRFLIPVSVAGETQEYLTGLVVSVDPDVPEGRGSMGIAYRENRIVTVNDFQAEVGTTPLRAEADSRVVWGASCSVPILLNQQPYAVLNVYSNEKDFFDAAVLNLMAELSRDLSFALDSYAHEAARRFAEEQLELSAKVFRQSHEAIIITDKDNNIVSVNRAFTNITGYQEQEVIGKKPKILSAGRQDREFYRVLWDALLKNNFWQGELWNRHKNGTVYPEWLTISVVRDEANEIVHYIATFTDITLHKAAEQKIEHLAHYDVLTNLPNRLLLKSRVDYELIVAERYEKTFALLFIDLDHFKNINDSLGHSIGDQVLVAVAERLLACVREEDTVARLGGDEFNILLADGNGNAAALVANKVITALSAPILYQQYQLYITASIGIGIYPDNGDSYETLSKNADTALYQAKKHGRNQYQFFTPTMQQQSERRMQIEHDLRHAIARNELLVYFQPQVNTQTGQINGAEALLRWQHPVWGMVSPVEFIPVAEECGLILPIGEWVLDQAVAEARQWHDAGFPLTVAVNLSLAQFRANTLFGKVQQTLERHQMPAQYLELELTESIAMQNAVLAIEITEQLSRLGIKLSIDDFGTGYSSLSYLQRFSLHKLKIDQSFTRSMVGNKDSENIVDAIISLAKSLNLKTIAEGVETKQQLALFRQKACDEIQGYYFSKPIPAVEFVALMKRGLDAGLSDSG
ncbi:MAG: EAL domain-containing protein [Methylovulum sp.]|nr:EAL domain-containing protein [Methylovulum sp.]